MDKKEITLEQIDDAEKQIISLQRKINYDTKDLTLEIFVQKFIKEEFFIPSYQRKFIWDQNNKVSFVESVLLGLPTPFKFFAECKDGNLEIIDGAQRIQTIVEFIQGKLKLSKLSKLTKLEGFTFLDLPKSRQKKILNRTLRVVVLDVKTSLGIRQDLFKRINTSGKKATDSEIRRGSYPGKLTTFIEECCNNKLFIKLCPIPKKKEDRQERFELVLRFYAYLYNYKNFEHSVNKFLDDFLIENLNTFNELQYKTDFENMLKFVQENFKFGFAKTQKAETTPRVRFEAISVGVALALKEYPNLQVDNIDWINSTTFKKQTTSDASNNNGKLAERVEFVRDKLIGRKNDSGDASNF